jgi:putative inorganic carbon (HCO3(-)) transporter
MLVLPATWILHWLLVRLESRKSNYKKDSSVQDQKPGFAVTPLNAALLLLAVMVLVSLWTTYDISYSLGKIAGVVFGFGVFFTVVRLCDNKRGLWISLGVFTAVGLMMAVLGLVGTNWAGITKISFFTAITSHIPGLITGLQGAESGFNANEVSGTLVWILPMALLFIAVALLSFRNIKHVFGKIGNVFIVLILLGISFFIAAVLVLTQSRGAYFGITAAILCMIFFGLPKKGKWVFIVAILILVIASGLFFSSHRAEINDWLNPSTLADNPSLSLDSLKKRVEIWSTAIKGIQDFPFTGMGLNVFRKLGTILYPDSMLVSYSDLGHAHNEFLQAGVDLGIPGMIAFISLYIGSFWMLVQTWKTSFRQEKNQRVDELDHQGHVKSEKGLQGPFIRALVLGLGGGLLAHLVYGMVDAVALGAKPGFVFWMLLGLISGLFALVTPPRSMNTPVEGRDLA